MGTWPVPCCRGQLPNSRLPGPPWRSTRCRRGLTSLPVARRGAAQAYPKVLLGDVFGDLPPVHNYSMRESMRYK